MSTNSLEWSSAIASEPPPVPANWHWALGLFCAILILGLVSMRYAGGEQTLIEAEEDRTLVSLGGAPQRLDPPPPEVETSEEAQVVAERADDAPPPAAPVEPRVVAGSSDGDGRTSSGTGAGSGRAAPPAPPPPPPASPPLPPRPTRVSQRFIEISTRAYSRQIVYPRASLDREQQGRGVLRVKIARDGTVLQWELVRPTGYNLLDSEIKRVANVVGKLDPLPVNFASDTTSVDIPIVFTIEYFD